MDNVAVSTDRKTTDDTVKPTIVIVPGLRDHVPEHWQTLLEARLAKVACVPRRKGDKLSCAAWVAELDGTLEGVSGPVVLVAHSAGVMITVHWAQMHARRIQGALLAAPVDLETPLPEGYPTLEAIQANGWLPIPRGRLPFPAIVAASTNDPLCAFARSESYARDWGASLLNAGEVGHLNPAAGFGEWKEAEILLDELWR